MFSHSEIHKLRHFNELNKLPVGHIVVPDPEIEIPGLNKFSVQMDFF